MTRPRTAPTPAGVAPSARTGGSLLAVLLLVAAIVLNLAQFRSIDQSTIDRFDAVHRNDTADIVDLAYRECAWCRDRYGLHLALGTVAPGSTVIVPAGSPYAANPDLADELTLRLYAYGRVAAVEWVEYQPPADLWSETDPTRFVVASGPGGTKGVPWLLALDRPAPDVPGDPDTFVARALADGEHRRPTGPPRQLVLLRWDTPREGSGHGHQDLLIEASLLPEPARAELAR